MTPGQDSVIASLARRVDDLTKRVQELEAARLHADDRAMHTAERHYRALGRDTEAPGKALGVDMTYFTKPSSRTPTTVEDKHDPDDME